MSADPWFVPVLVILVALPVCALSFRPWLNCSNCDRYCRESFSTKCRRCRYLDMLETVRRVEARIEQHISDIDQENE